MANASAGIAGDWAPTRIEVYRALLSVPGLELSHWVDPLLLRLPYRLGETTADAAFPFAFDDDFNDLTDNAVDDVADLLRRRREAAENRASSVPEVEIGGRGLRPASWSMTGFTEGSPGLLAARRGVRLDAALDTALYDAWIPRGHGGPLFDRLRELYARLVDEDQRSGLGPSLLALGLLGTIAHFESKKARAKVLVSRTFPLERVDRAVGSALFSLAEAALAQACAGAPPAYGLQAQALLCPLSFYSFRQQPLLFDINPWGLSESFADEADRVWLSLLEEDPSPRRAEARLAEAFHADPTFFRRAAESAGVMLLRRRTLDWLAFYDGHDPELSAMLCPVVVSTEALCKALSEPKALLARLARFAKGLKPDPAGEAATAALSDSLKKGMAREDEVTEVAKSYAVLALDRVCVDSADRARGRLKDRRSEYTREQLVADYLAGRLYRLSTDGKPVRRAPLKKTQGHLFIDLKGFTQRTYRAKEVVMAEFLRTEFYEPILAAASKRVEGLGGEQQLSLQNLLGDAAVFSGEMSALAELAQDIQRICRAYAEKLRGRTGGGGDGRDVEARRAEIEGKLSAELEALRAEAAALERGMQAKRSMPVSELERALFGALTLKVAEAEARRHEALTRGRQAEARQHQEAVAALRSREKALFARIETLFGPARDQLVADLVLSEDRNLLKKLERRAGEARAFAKSQLRSLDEEARATRGGGLEAGLFITFGANAEIASMADQHFGTVKVAIAEKINEAARGTARNAMIKSKLDGLLAKARAQRGNPRLELPFRVYVDSANNLLLPADLSELIDGAVRDREPARAREAAKAVAETVLRDLARAMGMGDGQAPEVLSNLSDIYNTGEALSGEALSALLTQTSASRSWFRKVISPEELDAEFHDLFAFVYDTLELIVTLPPDGDVDQATVFRRAGQVQFRGFEAKSPTSVWEMLRPDSPFCLLLVQKHLPLWAAEARGRLAGDLPT